MVIVPFKGPAGVMVSEAMVMSNELGVMGDHEAMEEKATTYVRHITHHASFITVC
jgi:hypothetical protein